MSHHVLGSSHVCVQLLGDGLELFQFRVAMGRLQRQIYGRR